MDAAHSQKADAAGGDSGNAVAASATANVVDGPSDPSRYDPSAYDDIHSGSGSGSDSSDDDDSGSSSSTDIDMEYIRSLAAASQEKEELESAMNTGCPCCDPAMRQEVLEAMIRDFESLDLT